MNNDNSKKITEQDIIRLAKTVNRTLPKGYEEEVMAKVDEIERKKHAKPTTSPKAKLEPVVEKEEELEP